MIQRYMELVLSTSKELPDDVADIDGGQSVLKYFKSTRDHYYSLSHAMSSKRKAPNKDIRAPKVAREAHSSPREQQPVVTIAIGRALPSEIMCLIFQYIPLRPRLLVLSFVCKQWRVLVLRSVRKVSAWEAQIEDPDRVLSLFPSIEELVIDSNEVPLTVPCGLQRLELWRARLNRCCYADVVANDPRNLTSLCVNDHSNCTALIPLLRSCQSTLREVRPSSLLPQS